MSCPGQLKNCCDSIDEYTYTSISFTQSKCQTDLLLYLRNGQKRSISVQIVNGIEILSEVRRQRLRTVAMFCPHTYLLSEKSSDQDLQKVSLFLPVTDFS